MSTRASTPRHAPTISLLIATYNWPQALALVLASVRAQRVPPLEVVIADDGSGDDTRRVIEREGQHFPVPIVHVWHEDTGFRLAAIRNKAIAQSRGEYVVQIDGDIVVHSEFMAGHVRFARRGSYVQGSRALLSEAVTNRLFAGEDHAWLGRLLTDLIGDHLVDGDAGVEDRPLVNFGAGKEAAGHGRVNAMSRGRLIVEAVDDVDLFLQRFKRQESLAELDILALTFSGPVVVVDAATHKQGCEAFREFGLPGGGESAQRFEPGQGHGDADSAENRTAVNFAGLN